MTTRREIIQDAEVLKKRVDRLEEKVDENRNFMIHHVHDTPFGFTGTAVSSTATNTATSFYVVSCG